MSAALETPRLVLREPVDGDAAALLLYHRVNEDRFARWEPEFVDELAHFARWVSWRRGESALARGCSFLAFDRANAGALVAVVNLYGVAPGVAHSAMLGYSADGAYEGKGYAHEAVAAVVAFGFASLNLHRITANYDPANERSGALLRRLGFAVEGYARDLLYLRGTWRDQVMTALTNPAWKPPAASG